MNIWQQIANGTCANRTCNLANASCCVGTELMHVKTVPNDIAPGAKTVIDVAQALKPLGAAFHRHLLLVQLALTPTVSTASCERSF
jgi:hypothetical protein